MGWQRLHKKTENLYDNSVSTGSYIVNGNAKVYVNGKWTSLRRAIKSDPEIMENVWEKAKREQSAKFNGKACSGDFVSMWQLKGYGVNYAKYTGYTLIYWTACGDDSRSFPCPVHKYPGIGDRNWDDLNEKEQLEYVEVLRAYEHAHNAEWYMLLPPDAPIPTWDDIYKQGICYMDF